MTQVICLVVIVLVILVDIRTKNSKNICQIVKKRVDEYNKRWYNKRVEKSGSKKSNHSMFGKIKKNKKKELTYKSKYDIMNM